MLLLQLTAGLHAQAVLHAVHVTVTSLARARQLDALLIAPGFSSSALQLVQGQQGQRSEEDDSAELTGTSLPTDIDLSFMNGHESPSGQPSTAVHSHTSSHDSVPSLPGVLMANGTSNRWPLGTIPGSLVAMYCLLVPFLCWRVVTRQSSCTRSMGALWRTLHLLPRRPWHCSPTSP